MPPTSGQRAVQTTRKALSFGPMSPSDFVRVWYEVQPQPGTTYGEQPPIFGDAAADRRVREIAESRGYRLQPISTTGGVYPGALAAFKAMQAAAVSDGVDLWIVSDYRSPDQQRELFLERLGERYGRMPSVMEVASGAADAAIHATLDQRSAPGYSRHHSGYVFDLNRLKDSFADTDAYRWLAADNYQNAREFGFIPSYPPGVQAGPLPEPWEFAFIHDPFRIRGSA